MNPQLYPHGAKVLATIEAPTPPEKLNEEEGKRLAKLENMMVLGMERFLAVGEALLEIKENRLYRENYRSFRAYCEGRWNMSVRRGYQLVDVGEVVRSIPSVQSCCTTDGG